jgi:hypothetical protein
MPNYPRLGDPLDPIFRDDAESEKRRTVSRRELSMTDFTPPTTEEALARLTMPMSDAMRTQRAVRRLHTEPVDHGPSFELDLGRHLGVPGTS